MKSTLFILLLVCSVFTSIKCNTQKKIDPDILAIELDSIFSIDQKYRLMMDSVGNSAGWNSSEMEALWKKQNEIDSSNVKRIIEIIDEVGSYPGSSLVGSSAGKTAFYVLQHAPYSVQEQYYEMIVSAGAENELEDRLVAMYRDRYLMHRGEPQIFGSQVRIDYQTDSLTGEKKEHAYVWPISDTTNIDSLRLINGLGPLEEYLNQFGISCWNKLKM